MRLINTTTTQLEGFMANPPPFATCRQAKQTGIDYAWVDTCCIDKTSSAELTEAINSMFAWYAASKVCYAFLSDLGPTDAVDPLEPIPDLAACRWFTRGWTLQELIAPEAGLSRALEAVTGINGQVFRDIAVLADIPVARRMSWAAKRVTTRVEDMAREGVCQATEEIAKVTNDLTLFAWQAKVPESSNLRDTGIQKYRGILATSPAEFLEAGAVVAGDDTRFNEEFIITNKGMRINSGFGSSPGGCYVLNLNCSLHGDPTKQIGIYLKQHGASVYAREQPDKLVLQSEWQLRKVDTIYISKRLTPSQSVSIDKGHRHGFFFRRGLTSPPFSVQIVHPVNLWDSQRRIFLTHGMASFTGFITFSAPKEFQDSRVAAKLASLDPLLMGKQMLLVCGITAGKEQKELRPWIAICDALGQLELYGCLRDLKKLGEVGSRCNSKSILINGRIFASVEMEEAVVDGEPMYCVDLKFEDRLGLMSQLTIEEGPVVPRGSLSPTNYWLSS